MKRYREDFIEKIREIRKKEKLSFKRIGEKFNISSSTIRNWQPKSSRNKLLLI